MLPLNLKECIDLSSECLGPTNLTKTGPKNSKYAALKFDYVHKFGAFIKYVLGHPTPTNMNQATNEID